MTIRELFDFIVDPTIDDESVDSYLEEAQQKILARGDLISAEEEIADSVFVQSYIPKTLDHVKDAEEDVQRIISGKDTGDMYYHTITGLKKTLSLSNSSQSEKEQLQSNLEPVNEDPAQTTNSPALPDGESDTETDVTDEDDSDSDEDSSYESDKQTTADRKAARKENKKKVKEEKREARKTKVPKAMKKKKKKLAKAKKYR